MAAYATTAQLTAWAQDQRLPSDTSLTASVLEAASRSVDQYCDRLIGFAKRTMATPELARAVLPYRAQQPVTTGAWASLDGVVTPTSGLTVLTEDFWDTSGLVVELGPAPWGDWTTVPASDVTVDTRVDPGHPYTRLWIAGRRAEHARVTAKWGWSAVPDAVIIATMVTALSSLRRRYAPDGRPSVDGVPGTPISAELAAAAKRNLEPYRRRSVA